MTDPTEGRTQSAPNKDADERRRTEDSSHPEGEGFLASIGKAVSIFPTVPIVFGVGIILIIIILIVM